VVALGLGGPEEGHPADQFAAVFTQARNAGLPETPHAGEGAGPESVWAALKTLHASRIGHGVRAVEDPEFCGCWLKPAWPWTSARPVICGSGYIRPMMPTR
jgi:adenosine deaminase